MDAQPDPRLEIHTLSLGLSLPPGAEFGRSQLFSPALPSTHPLLLPPPSQPQTHPLQWESPTSPARRRRRRSPPPHPSLRRRRRSPRFVLSPCSLPCPQQLPSSSRPDHTFYSSRSRPSEVQEGAHPSSSFVLVRVRVLRLVLRGVLV